MPVSLPNRTINNEQQVIENYFAQMTRGRRYEEFVYSPANLGAPDEVLRENWNAAFLIYARGMSWATVGPVLISNQLPLNAIPSTANLVNDWPSVSQQVQDLLTPLLALRGVRSANATKLLYQKRPSLFPILDNRLSSALGLRWTPWDVPSTMSAINVFYDVLTDATNLASLTSLQSWVQLNSNLQVNAAVRSNISLVRLLDILAWME